jgi:hypothetical protein
MCIATLVAATVLVSGCYRTVYRGGDLAPRVSMERPAADEQVVEHVEKKIWNHYFLFALVPTVEQDVAAALAARVADGHEIRNLTIRHEVTFVNALIWALVGGIYNPMTTIVSGDVVRVDTP